jgi:hypothetical protein
MMPYFYALIGLNSIHLPKGNSQTIIDECSILRGEKKKRKGISAHYYEKLVYLTSPNWIVGICYGMLK